MATQVLQSLVVELQGLLTLPERAQESFLELAKGKIFALTVNLKYFKAGANSLNPVELPKAQEELQLVEHVFSPPTGQGFKETKKKEQESQDEDFSMTKGQDIVVQNSSFSEIAQIPDQEWKRPLKKHRIRRPRNFVSPTSDLECLNHFDALSSESDSMDFVRDNFSDSVVDVHNSNKVKEAKQWKWDHYGERTYWEQLLDVPWCNI